VKVIIDLLGTGFEIFIIMLFYEIFWEIRPLKKGLFILGFLGFAVINILTTTYFQNAFILPSVSIVITFCLSYYFISSITSRIFLSLIAFILIFGIEMLVGMLAMQLLGIPIEQLQNSLSSYALSVLVSKLLTIFLVYLLRFFMSRNRQQGERHFNLLMALMPTQSIILCFIIYDLTTSIDNPRTFALGLSAAILSLCLVFISMFILNNHRRALVYKTAYELSQHNLKIQIDHYQELYQVQHEIRAIRHDISNNLIAISGMLEEGRTKDAVKFIDAINTDVKKTSNIVVTGLPSIDAVISAKINKAGEFDIKIIYKVLLDGKLNIDQFDLSIIIANALDNAIEGIKRSGDVDRIIAFSMANKSDYISIIVENPASGPADEDLRTSKPDKPNHGFGINQMKTVAQKYDGDIQAGFDPELGKFSLKVLLKNRSV